jgi:hypothetical protein
MACNRAHDAVRCIGALGGKGREARLASGAFSVVRARDYRLTSSLPDKVSTSIYPPVAK